MTQPTENLGFQSQSFSTEDLLQAGFSQDPRTHDYFCEKCGRTIPAARLERIDNDPRLVHHLECEHAPPAIYRQSSHEAPGTSSEPTPKVPVQESKPIPGSKLLVHEITNLGQESQVKADNLEVTDEEVRDGDLEGLALAPEEFAAQIEGNSLPNPPGRGWD